MSSIDLLVVTGAGASTAFGAGAPIPMMDGWAEHLRAKLGDHFASAIGLTPGLTGAEFEERIGEFLTFARSLPAVRAFPALGRVDNMTAPDGNVDQWFRQAEQNARQVQQSIWESLDDLFPLKQFNLHAAGTAWGRLLRNSRSDHLAVATTNYDQSIEAVLYRLKRRPFTGVGNNLEPGYPTYVDVEGIIDQPRSTPVLHLHGCIGWYVAPEGDLVALPPGTKYNADAGQPALLLPDPAKTYAGSPVEVLWEQLREGLARAERVLVLGHSLADQGLVDALRAVEPNRLAIALYPPSTTDPSWYSDRVEILTNLLGRRAWCIPLRFEAEPMVDVAMWMSWMNGNGGPGDLTPAQLGMLPG